MPYQFDMSDRLRQLSEAEWELAGDNGFVVIFDHGATTDGQPFWLYIAVKPSKYREFLSMLAQRATIHYGEYGRILRHGFDRYVPEDVSKEMQRKYGSDEGYEKWLQADLDKVRQEFLATKSAVDAVHFNELAAMLKKKQAE